MNTVISQKFNFLEENKTLFLPLINAVSSKDKDWVEKEATQLFENMLYFEPRDRMDICNHTIEILQNADYFGLLKRFEIHIEAIERGLAARSIAIEMKNNPDRTRLPLAFAFIEAASHDPDNLIYHADAGKHLFNAGRYTHAIGELSLVTGDHRAFGDLHGHSANYLRRAYLALRNLEAAEQISEQCLRVTGHHPLNFTPKKS